MGRHSRRVADQDREELLTGYMRGLIHGYVVAKKIAHYNQIKRDLGLNNGTVSYHLRVLEKSGVISSVKKDQKRFFYVGALPDGFNEQVYSDLDLALATEIMERPGVCAFELAKTAGVSQSSITYHVKRLERRGLVEARQNGMRKRLFLTNSADI